MEVSSRRVVGLYVGLRVRVRLRARIRLGGLGL
jgi:hypothetical protein